jgi:cell wall-associated NlpC family hydrolase
MSFVGRPYRWGGDNPLSGFDCSGLVCELLHSAGVITEDMNAMGLYSFLRDRAKWGSYGLGAIAFYGKPDGGITHVGFCVDGYRMLEAGGGDDSTINEARADRQNAFVRIRLITARKDFVCVMMPEYKLK